MNILAIDTSTEVLSLALSVSGSLWQAEISAGTRHSELLLEWTDKLVKSAMIEPADLNLVLCMQGPGSFTGLRIGYAAAKGFSEALGIPVKAIPTLDCIAASQSVWPGFVLPVIDAKKNSFFAAVFREGRKLSEYMDAEAQTIAVTLRNLGYNPDIPLLVTGPGAELFYSRITAENLRQDFSIKDSIRIDPMAARGRAPEMLRIYKILQSLNEYDSLSGMEGLYSGPLYLRKSDAELSLDK